MSMRLVKGTIVPVFAIASLVLVSCGGSKSSSTEATTGDGAASETTTPVDEAALLANFCKAAKDDSINAKNLADDAQVEEVAKQMSVRASALVDLVNSSPSAVRDDVSTIADAATAMAESLTADPTLANFNQTIEKFASADLEAASKNVDAFITKNCEG